MAIKDDFLPLVYEITDRPDLVNETQSALSRALLKAHYKGWFIPDFETNSISVPGNTVPFTVAVPAAHRKTCLITADSQFNVDEIPAKAIFDTNVLVKKRNYFYIAGASINIFLRDTASELIQTFYKIPDWETSFIANQYPDAITNYAAARVLAFIQASDQSKYYEQLGAEQMNEIIQSHSSDE